MAKAPCKTKCARDIYCPRAETCKHWRDYLHQIAKERERRVKKNEMY